MHRLGDVLADDVPAGHVKRAEDRQAGLLGRMATTGAAVDLVEQLLGVVGVVADDRRVDEILDHRRHDGPAEAHRQHHHLAVAGNSGVGV